MDASWWPLLVGVAVLALIATVVDGWGRGRRPRRRRRWRRRPPRS
ncbi:hypothetical protein [Streptomyces odontomachi]